MSARALFDADSQSWLIAISDAQLDLLSEDWSQPVQLKAIRDLASENWKIDVRAAQ